MKIHLAQHYGLCFGVRDALALAENTARAASVTVLGALAHNPLVRERLKQLGAREGALEAEAAPTPTVLITAHGASHFQRDRWKTQAEKVVDATCPLVRHAHTQLHRLVKMGYFPVVIGKPGHVEVRGLVGDFPQAVVIENEPDLERLPLDGAIGVISQTTQPIQRVRELVETIKQARPLCTVTFCDTVCQPTKDRQSALSELCDRTQVIVVVGGKSSHNTRHLIEEAQKRGVRTYGVETPDDLQGEWFAGIDCVGLTAGTSTLPETVEAVRQKLLTLNP
jgi:4-hydroxy-3-methylbut-2-enyl diphosphate reductase